MDHVQINGELNDAFFYKRMVEEVEDYAIVLLDKNGLIQNWNAGAQKIKGYEAEEIIGKHFRIFYQPEDQASHIPEQLIQTARETGKALHEGWRIRKDGSRFWGSIVITALHNDQGEIVGFSKVTRDLTDKKIAEDKLQEYLQQLEMRNLELEQFAYVASHDLQEPLRKIRTFTEVIENNFRDEAFTKRYFEKINSSAQRMSELIKSILNYSRLSKNDTGNEPTNLNNILDEVRSDYELMIKEKKATIVHDALPSINAIPLQVHQLFANLIGNALKFANSDPVITITCRLLTNDQVKKELSLPRHKKFLEITFKDNGIGFDPLYEKKIFNLFQRLHNKQEYSGTGIGLAVCKRIMENHHGFIHAAGNPGKGASFYVYFPVE